MRVCLYTEYFDGLENFLLDLLDQKYSLTIISSKALEIKKSFWMLGLDHPEKISGSFFIAEESYTPSLRQYPSISFFSFDLIMRCSNVKDFGPMESHAVDGNIPIYDFKPHDEVDPEKFLKEHKKLFDYVPKEDDPFINIVTPVYNTNIKFLRECVESVDAQVYTSFKWFIINDGSNDIVTKELKKIEESNPDKYEVMTVILNSGIAKSVDRALKLIADDGYVAFLDSDDILEPEALYEVANYIRKNPDIKAFYTNQKNIDLNSELVEDIRKPDFNMELFYQCMYINHMKVIHRDVIKKAGRPNPEFKGSWDWEWFLRIAERYKIGHLRKLLYRWRRKPKRNFLEENATYNHLALKAVYESNTRTRLVHGNIRASELSHLFKIERLVDDIPDEDIDSVDVFRAPRVKILILCKKNPMYLKLLLDSIGRESKYPDYQEIITQHVDDEDKEMTEFLQTTNCTKYRCNVQGFNYSKITNWQIDNGCDCEDDYVLILNDDIIFQNDCISEMVACSQQFDAGIVGCKLIWPGKGMQFVGNKYTTYGANVGHVQHCGVDLYSDKGCGHRYYGMPNDTLALNYVKEVEAVTFACVLIRKDVIDKIKFDEKLPVNFNDIDYCIEAKKLGHKIYYTPWAVALHFESVTKDDGPNEDFNYFDSKHSKYLAKFPTFDERHAEMLQGL